MASTLTAQTLTVTISESLVLNSQPINSENQLTIASIGQVDKRIVNIPIATEVTVLAFGTAVAAGTVIRANVKYIRITNKDATNFVRIRVKKTGAETFDIKINAGQSFILSNASESVSATAAAFSAFVDADSINAQADTAAVDIEMFVASIN
jgi:hypothetical protein